MFKLRILIHGFEKQSHISLKEMQKDNTQGIVKITEWSNITQAKECWQPPEVGEDSSTKFSLEPLEEKKPY